MSLLLVRRGDMQQAAAEPALAGTITITSAFTGDLTNTPAGLEGTIAITSSLTGDVSVTGATYADEVLADSPSGYWRLGDAVGSGTAVAAAGTDGTVVGGVTFGQTGALVGDSDTAALFNGSTGLVNLGSQVVGADKSFTHECWFKTNVVNTNLWMIAEGNTADNDSLVGLSLQNGKVQGMVRTDAAVATTLQTTGTYNNNAWHHAVLTADGTDVRLYVDGSEAATSAAVPTGTITLNTQTIGAGRRITTSLYFSGSIDEVAVYPAALSLTRIQAHYAAGT